LATIDGRLVVYSLGDLVFDLQHDARSQQGLIIEQTRRPGLAQVDLHLTLIPRSQPTVAATAAATGPALDPRLPRGWIADLDYTVRASTDLGRKRVIDSSS
jgi:hypothetical protein